MRYRLRRGIEPPKDGRKLPGEDVFPERPLHRGARAELRECQNFCVRSGLLSSCWLMFFECGPLPGYLRRARLGDVFHGSTPCAGSLGEVLFVE